MNAPALPVTSNAEAAAPSKAKLWTGRFLSGFVVLFLAFDVTIHLMLTPEVLEASKDLKFPVAAWRPVALLELLGLVLYVVPRTALLGAVLLTGYLGGAICIHVIVGNPMFSHTLFPIYTAMFLWGGLFLRDPRVKAIFAAR